MLNQEQIDHFIVHGYVHLSQCFDCGSDSLAGRWVAESWARNGIDPDDQATWPEDKIHMPISEQALIRDMSPAAEEAIFQLCGGQERIIGAGGGPDDAADAGLRWNNAFIANYGFGRQREWRSPTGNKIGWHKDGDFFLHFLDSPEQALLSIIVFSDIEHQGGGTFIAPDSVPLVARFLAVHPEGVQPNAVTHRDGNIIEQCQRRIEVTARAGDVLLMHPYMLHASSYNHSDRARFIINPCCAFKQPMDFMRRDDSAFSPVELAVLRALDCERYDFKISGERQALVPERIAQQAELLRLEQLRKQ